MGALPTWKQSVLAIVQRQPELFALADILAHADDLRTVYPDNRFIDAKIRQSLQVLRDQGALVFLGHGRYRRLDAAPRFSPLFDSTVAETYTNRSQVARVLIETWAEFNLYCVRCSSDVLERLPANAPVADFRCAHCGAQYQLKAKDGRFTNLVIGAALAPTLAAVREKALPEYVFVEFDRRRASVVYVDALPGAAITEARVIPRKPLGAHARRAGWQGCNIDITARARA